MRESGREARSSAVLRRNGAGTDCDDRSPQCGSLVVSPFLAERSALDELLRDEGYEVSSWATREEGLAW